MSDEDAMRRELEQVDDMIAELRGRAEQDRAGDPSGAELPFTGADQHQALIGVLADRRGKLRERLGLAAEPSA